MIVSCHMCMPEGDAMRARFGDLMEMLKRDNRAVIAAMLADGIDVPDTVGDLGLRYVPAPHRKDEHAQPIMELYGLHDMVTRGTFSCGDAVAFESAVLEEKYRTPTLCIAVAQGDEDMHAVFVTVDDVIDPTANFKAKRRWRPPHVSKRDRLAGSACTIEDGRVVCVEEDVCAVDEDGRWHCPPMPQLSGRIAQIGEIRSSANGGMWARTADGAVVPVRRRFR
jgi:hypothetical protein